MSNQDPVSKPVVPPMGPQVGNEPGATDQPLNPEGTPLDPLTIEEAGDRNRDDSTVLDPGSPEFERLRPPQERSVNQPPRRNPEG
jgi:hypothetical protein